MISWHDGTTWDHRAYWGEDVYQYAGRHSMGALPAPGQWVRLEVPASVVGVGGMAVSGMKFNVHSGKAWFDRVGPEPGTIAASPAAPSWSERLRSFGALLAYGRMNLPALRYQSLPTMASAAMAPHSTATPRRYSLYTPELNLLAETAMTTAGSPSIAYEYIWFAGQPVAQVTTSTNEVSWYFNDHLGTPVLQTDATANVVWRVEREPYGATYVTRVGAERHQPLSFPGQEETVEGEVAFNVFRWYRDGWGRYTQSDPMLRFSTRSELYLDYAYVLLNPVRLIDPMGLFTVSGSCKKCEGLDPKAKDLSEYIIDETSAWCKSKLGLIKNVQLRKCIADRCTNGIVKCESGCELGVYGSAPGAFAGKFGEWLAQKIYSPKTVVVCLNVEGNYLGEAGNTVIHEWAHGCGCDSDIPGNCEGIPGLPKGMPSKAKKVKP